MGKATLKHQMIEALKQSGVDYGGTEKQYIRDLAKYADFCKNICGCRRLRECGAHIQDYADHLRDKGLKPSTIHTYLAPVCRIFGVDMGAIHKPKRISAENTRSRGKKAVDNRSDAKPSASPRLAEFAQRVGIRREEYWRLRGRNFVQDESGHWCVEVERGKGGKYQLQRVAPEDVEFVGAYFAGKGPEEYVFTKEELKNKLDLHALRGENAKRQYWRYIEEFKGDPACRERLYDELTARWARYNRKQPMPSYESLQTPYKVRGANRARALKLGYPTTYDRLALLAVSVFHLSHWRLGVTVCNYMLA